MYEGSYHPRFSSPDDTTGTSAPGKITDTKIYHLFSEVLIKMRAAPGILIVTTASRTGENSCERETTPAGDRSGMNAPSSLPPRQIT
jgi:hypothetical protein